MNKENRQKVLDYLIECDCSPLYFNGYESPKDEFNPDKYSILDMIKRVLTLSKRYASYNSNTEDFETSNDRWRSVLDIWRHIIYYYPTIEIFDVMHVLYEYYHKEDTFDGQFCNDIEKRTFRNYRGQFQFTNYMSTGYMFEHSHRIVDEFGLEWQEWKDI